MNEIARPLSPAASLREAAGAYYELCKPRVVALIVFTAMVGMFLASPGLVPLDLLLTATTGIALASASAAAINHVVDQRIDAMMARTSDRPLPRSRIPAGRALLFALVLGALGLGLLAVAVNLLTAALTFASLIGYAVIYTMYLKRATPQNIVIGGAAGAAPPILGWAAVSGTVDPYALLLFLIIFTWTPPHFWALAIYRRADYARAEVPMLPVTHGTDFTRLQVLLYTVLTAIVTVLPFATHMSGLFYLGGALALNAGFLYYAWRLFRTRSDRVAIRTFAYSIVYLMGIFAFLLIDHYIPMLSRLFGMA